MEKRIEKDGLGEKAVLWDAYWGIHTQRALENFSVSSQTLANTNAQKLVSAIALVKKAAAQANEELGFLSSETTKAVIQACDEIVSGKFMDQFPLDVYQGGAGTSTNMNVNEVIANRALEILGKNKGDYDVIHPLEHVNLHQSTNDVYPSSLKIACIFEIRDLAEHIASLQGVFQKKEKEFAHIIKLGRTEMQEAVPLTLGAEFSAFSECLSRDRWRTFKCEERLRTLNIGGTAVGTGLTAPRSYIFLVIEKLRALTGLGIARGENVVDQTANSDCFVEVSAILKAHASNLIKISEDLRLLSLLGEIHLPKKQSGSSVMPGKVNPVILESVIQAGLKVMANDMLIAEATSRSRLQINEFMPLLADALLGSLEILRNAGKMLGSYVQDIQADEKNIARYLEHNESIVTAFLPFIGYEKAENLLKEFHGQEEKNLKIFLTQKLGATLVERVLSSDNIMSLGHKKYEDNA